MTIDRSDRIMDATSKQKPDKKPYQTPALQHYGDLPTITQNVGRAGAKDNGTAPNIRTSI